MIINSSFPLSLSVLMDLNINEVWLSASLFPAAPSNARVHRGSRDARRVTASTILTEVKLINSKGGTSVIAVSFPGDFWVGFTHP